MIRKICYIKDEAERKKASALDTMLKFSIVIPIYNEEQSIVPIYLSLRRVMERMEQSYEVIFVNDGSSDRSAQVLNSIDLKPPNLTIVNLNKHSGQSAAMQAGFDVAEGELIITIDGDLQNEPGDIPNLLDKMKDGYDVVCGWRYDRKDPWGKLLASNIACTLRRIITKEDIHDFGCGLRIFKKEVLRDIYLSSGMHRFFTLITSRLGYKTGEIKVKHCPRRYGISKYNIHNRLRQCIMDTIRILLFDIHQLMKCRSSYQIKEVIRK
jgi:glycosyltransferase involved in cell wall biosynthesis